MTPATESVSPYGDVVRSILDELGAPPVIVDSVSFGRAAGCEQAPRAGCEQSPGVGEARMWGRFDLAAWHTAAAHLLLDADDVVDLVATAQLLEQSGEGAQVWWAIDLVGPYDLQVPWALDYALSVTDLVCVGPPLPPETVTAVSERLLAWGVLGPPNSPVRHGALTVCATTWAYGVV